ncbi:MAG: hypothetical protein WC517_00720 [Patescibacteria group bacterium]
MPLDDKELLNPSSEQPTAELAGGVEGLKPAQEAIRTSESPALESGDILESGRLAGGSERVYRPDMMPQPTPAYAPTTDESYVKYKQIEKVLEEDLGEIYNNLTPQEQKIFKIKGEETARSIFQLVYHKTKVKVKKIVKLIKNWLKSVPGINKFFLEQEAKIKADKIAALAGESRKIEF